MAVIDSLLALVPSQRADGLIINSDEAPLLLFGSEQRPLSMPPIPKATVEGFAAEIGRGHTDGSGTLELLECRYETPSGDEFQARIEANGTAVRLVLRPASSTAEVSSVVQAPESISPPAADVTPSDVSADGHFNASYVSASLPSELFDLRLIDLLGRLQQEHASDLILSSGSGARMRSGGVLRELPGYAFDDADILAIVAPAMTDRAHEQLRADGSVDVALDLPLGDETTRYRVNVFEQQRGLAAALRPIRSVVPTLAQLHLPDHLHKLAEYRNGLVLVTGPTGSGKSTTLAALVEHLNCSADRHIITLEDPIEYLYQPKRSLIHQRELGRHVESFATGLRAALREDPDVILVGEMRDRDTIAAALTAAETGHLVLSTLHSGSPWTAVDRMIDVFPPDQQGQVRLQLADVLRAVLSQHLLRSTRPPLRVPAFEKLHVTAGVASLIRDGKLHQLKNSIQTGRDDGMVSLERTLADLLQAGQIDAPTARAAARDERLFDDLSPHSRAGSPRTPR